MTLLPPAPLSLGLPSVRVAIRSGVVAAGVAALLTSAGFALSESADVTVVDDGWLDDSGALAEAPAVVALGSAAWVSVLSDLVSGGWAALPADATPEELLAGVLGAAAGLAVLPPAQVHPADTPDDEDDYPAPPSDITLTPRERDVLARLAEGLSNKRVARELGVSESTVKFHVQAVYSKLGVQSRAGAVTRGIQLGLVSV